MVNPLLSRTVTNKAVSLAQSALKNEAVRKQIQDAPEAVGRWARSLQKTDGGGGILASLARLDPTARYSEPSLERRLEALSRNVELVFPDPDDPARRSTLKAVYELHRGLLVASPLPLLKRKKVYMRIDTEVSVLEQALVDAVLPPLAGSDADTDDVSCYGTTVDSVSSAPNDSGDQ